MAGDLWCGAARSGRARHLFPLLVVGSMLACACGGNDGGRTSDPTRPGSTQARPAEPLGIPPEVAAHADDWPLPGRDYSNSRARTDSVITRDNVDRLEVAWSAPLPGAASFGNAATTPLVVGDTVYVQDLQSNVHAVDLATGKERWTHEKASFQIGPNGVALGYGKLYAADGDGTIFALDADTGDEVWTTRIVDDVTGIDIQPTVVDGLVFASTVPVSIGDIYRGGARGVIWALDAGSGEKVWSFDTVEEGLWGNPDVNSGGGAWYPPAVDVERGLIYWGTGNPAPFPGSEEFPNGSSRPGDNLYTDSVVALDVRTGKLVWYHQAFPHDLFDRDLQLSAIADLPGSVGPRSDRLVIGTGKGGHVIALDPDTGEAVSDTEVGIHRNDDLTELDGPTEVLPGLYGGVETPPAVADGIVYAAVMNEPSTHEPDRENFLGGAPLGTTPGEVVAVDVSAGEVLWSTKVDGDPLGGAIVVGDLVATATFQGTIYFLDRATGEVVRTLDAPGGVNGWAAATRDTIVWPVGMADPPALVAYRLAEG